MIKFPYKHSLCNLTAKFSRSHSGALIDTIQRAAHKNNTSPCAIILHSSRKKKKQPQIIGRTSYGVPQPTLPC